MRTTHQRWIIHVDLDAFFASVEELLTPAYRGKPLIVGGDPRYRGVVSAASYPARAYGVHSAMPVVQALRLCPQAIVVPPRHDVYGEYSKRVMAILHEITPAIEQISIDEAFLDVTGCEPLWGPVRGIGETIQRRVLEEEQLPVSIGIAPSKLVAKIACDEGKPRGLVLVNPGEEAAFLAPLPIEKLWGVGAATGERLRAHGVETIGDLATWGEESLEGLFGKNGRGLYQAARGIDPSPVHTSHERRSISQERTFARDEPLTETMYRRLLTMSEDLAGQLRRRRTVAQTVRIKLRYADFTTFTRQKTLSEPTDQGQVIYEEARRLLAQHCQPGRLLRLLGVAVSGLLEGGGYQLNLFDHTDQRRIRLNRALDAIRAKHGRGAIRRASEIADRSHADKPGEGKKGDGRRGD